MPDLSYLLETSSTRFELCGERPLMKAVVTTANGGVDKLVYKDVPIPEPRSGEVLVKVLAAGMNNTEINTRLGWYSSSVVNSTQAMSDQAMSDQAQEKDIADGGWNDKTPFPMIQGTDCCGEIVSLAPDVTDHQIGTRVLVRPCMRKHGFESVENIWMASDFDGAFAQYVCVPASEVFAVNSSWSNAELGSIPCAYGTAENMLARAQVDSNDHVLVTGASGGVGSAVVQLAKRRGARVTAIASASKLARMTELGADYVLARDSNLEEHITNTPVSVVVDNVAGAGLADLLNILERGGRYVSSGAIAGPVVTLDMRKIYLKDITLIGCTCWDEDVFPNLIRYIENNEIQPLVAKTFELQDIALAQTEFMEKRHIGNFVLIPPH